MARIVQLKLLTAALGMVAAALPAVAQQAPAASSSPVFAPKEEPKSSGGNASKRPRAISPEVSAALAAASPKYTPAPPKPEPKPESEQVDMREVDKPKNQIIRLPKYIVQEQKPIVFSERAITTDKGLADIAVRRYISDVDRALNRFTLPLFGTSVEQRALAMYAEDERLKNMTDLRANAVDAAKSDPAAGAYILREARQTYLRSSDFGWNGGGPK
jgi:hypothetical protein